MLVARDGTRSSTVVLAGRNGGIVLVERNFSTGGAPAEQVRYEFELDRFARASST